jgi:hypothetical protein
MSVRRALPLIGADLSRRTAGRPGVSRSEAIQGMPSSVSGESRRRPGGSARLRSRGRASAADPSVQRSPVAVRVLSGVPRASRPAVAASPLWRGLAVALCAEAEARYPTPGLRSRATPTNGRRANELMHGRTLDPAFWRVSLRARYRLRAASAARVIDYERRALLALSITNGERCSPYRLRAASAARPIDYVRRAGAATSLAPERSRA